MTVDREVTLDELADRPYEMLHALRAESPVVWVPAITGWLVTSHQLVLEALRDPSRFTVDDPRFSTAKVVGTSMLSLDGAEHARHRSPFVAPFRRSQSLRDFRRWLEAECRERVATLRPLGTAELREGFAGPLAVDVISRVLALEDVDSAELLRWYRSIVASVVDVGAGGSVSDAGRAAFGDLGSAVRRSIASSPASLPAQIEADGGLTVEEIVSNTAVLLFGAIETTEAAITNAILHTLTATGMRDRHREEPAFLDRIIEESLRLEPASAVVDRYAVHDTHLGNQQVRAGDFVQLSLLAANRDPAVFAEPDCFDPDRDHLDRHLTFVQGPHACLGLHMARLEARCAVGAVIDGLPAIEIVSAESSRPSGLVFRKPDRLTARWRPA